MWTFSCTSAAVTALVLTVTLTPASADDRYIVKQNQTGLTLPGVTLPSGYDEIRAADGTTCRSSMAGPGAYLDSGLIGGGLDARSSNSVSVYGRVVVPLGEKPPRLNCDRLYQLELQRLQLEVELMKRGLDPDVAKLSTRSDWATKGWSKAAPQ